MFPEPVLPAMHALACGVQIQQFRAHHSILNIALSLPLGYNNAHNVTASYGTTAIYSITVL